MSRMTVSMAKTEPASAHQDVERIRAPSILPAGIAPGVHAITLSATGSDGSSLMLTQSFTVASNGTFSAIGSVTGQVTGGLAATGVDGPLALGATSLAALLVLVGVGLMVARRRAEALSS